MYPDVRVDGACEGQKFLTCPLGGRQALQVPTGDRWGLALRPRGAGGLAPSLSRQGCGTGFMTIALIPAAPARAAAGHRSPAAVGNSAPAEQAHACPGPQEPVHGDRLLNQCTETVTSWAWPAAGFEEPPPSHPSRRGRVLATGEHAAAPPITRRAPSPAQRGAANLTAGAMCSGYEAEELHGVCRWISAQ